MKFNFYLLQKSLYKLIFFSTIVAFSKTIVIYSHASDVQGSFQKVPRDVIFTHIFKDLSARRILNFSQTCKRFQNMGDNHETVLLAKTDYQIFNQVIKDTAKTSDKTPLRETLSLGHYNKIFDKEMEKYKNREKNKILEMIGFSSEKKLILLQQLAVRLLFIKDGYFKKIYSAADDAKITALFATFPVTELPQGQTFSSISRIDYYLLLEENYPEKREARIASTKAIHSSAIFFAKELTKHSTENAVSRDTWKAAYNVTDQVMIEFLKDSIAKTVSIFLASDQCKALTNNNENGIKVGRFAWQVANFEASRIMAIKAASFIEDVGLKLEIIISEDKKLPPFYNRITFIEFLKNKELYQAYLENLKDKNSTHLVDEGMEIIASVFDN